MEKYKYKDGFFIQTEDYKNIEIGKNDKNEILNNFNSFNSKENSTLNGYCINDDYIFLWKKKLFRFIND